MIRVFLVLYFGFAFGTLRGEENVPARLPSTALLDWSDEDISVRIMDGAHRFVERMIEEATAARAPLWTRDPLAVGSYERKQEEHRETFRQALGMIEEPSAPRLEFYSTEKPSPDGVVPDSKVCEGETFEVHQVRWAVLKGLMAEGLYVIPKREEGLSLAIDHSVVLIPDAGESPEDLLGLTGKLPPEKQMGLIMARAGYRLLIPVIVSREPYFKEISRREWLYRMGFQMGRHLLAYEVQIALAAAEWLQNHGINRSLSLAGYGEGGLIALYAGVCEPKIPHVFVSGCFSGNPHPWKEPIDRNLFGSVRDFGFAELATLILPRTLLIEHTTFPEVSGGKGEITTPLFEEVQMEEKRVRSLLGISLLDLPSGIILADNERGERASFPAMEAFIEETGFHDAVLSRLPPLTIALDGRKEHDPKAREDRVFRQIEALIQNSIVASDSLREERYFFAAEPGLKPGSWSTQGTHAVLDPTGFIEKSKAFREAFRREIIGDFVEQPSPPNPRSRKMTENGSWTSWEVILDVYPELQSWGVLVIPKGIKPGEKRPVVVCQHGRNGVPMVCLDENNTAYNNVAGKLARRGFIVFCPHNLYRHEDRYRWLDRKANNIGATLFSFIVASHRQNLAWLKSLPQVDPKRIAFYGLSYGGETAMRVPAILEDYCLSICSGDFNQWTRKVADVNFPQGFMRSIEWEMPYWRLGQTFDYAEMAGLIFPRPFMVERGHHDRVAVDAWVAHEYAKVGYLYAQFNLSDRTEIEYFQGGHAMRGEGSFRFLHRHLNWPEP